MLWPQPKLRQTTLWSQGRTFRALRARRLTSTALSFQLERWSKWIILISWKSLWANRKLPNLNRKSTPTPELKPKCQALTISKYCSWVERTWRLLMLRKRGTYLTPKLPNLSTSRICKESFRLRETNWNPKGTRDSEEETTKACLTQTFREDSKAVSLTSLKTLIITNPCSLQSL